MPYGTAVVVEKFEEPESSLSRAVVRIHATIYVENDNHKGILIGAGGDRLKKIGQAARQELEGLLGQKVYLE
ncbi:KH domain-containing protein, partial [Acidobacteriia bacterium AH_259_A11_L15]|nr:KH domain-containing protein [Acidobacteriia bacterium AH_259_A11_L15]